MEAIKTALKTITEAKTVERIPAKGVDLDVAPLPGIFFYDEDEKRDRRNRLAIGDVQIVVFGYIPLLMEGYTDANLIADTLQGRIHEVMTQNLLTGSPLISNCIEGTVHKDYPSDEYLLLIMTYTVTYQHNWGDAFSNVNY